MRLQVLSLPLLSGLTIRRCRGLWCRSQTQLDPTLLWLWCRLAATAPIRPLTWEPPYATGAAQRNSNNNNYKKQKTKKKKNYNESNSELVLYIFLCCLLYSLIFGATSFIQEDPYSKVDFIT